MQSKCAQNRVSIACSFWSSPFGFVWSLQRSAQYLSWGHIPRILAPKSPWTCALLAWICYKPNSTIFEPLCSCTSLPTYQPLANQLVQIPQTKPQVCGSHSVFALSSSTLSRTVQVCGITYLLPRLRYQLESHHPKQCHCPCQGPSLHRIHAQE